MGTFFNIIIINNLMKYNAAYLIRTFEFALKTIRLFKNWSVMFSYISGGPGKTILKLRNGLNFHSNGNIADVVVLVENFTGETQYDSGLVTSPKIVVDIGANIGAFAAYIKTKYPSTTIYCYEPDPENFKNLTKNIQENNFKDVMLFNKAVGKQNGKITLYAETTEFGTANSSTIRKSDVSIDVECLTLEEIFKENNIEKCDLLKLDCEGCEYDIFYNTNTNIIKKVGIISLEYHDLDLNTGKNLADYLEQSKFKCKIQATNRNPKIGYINAVNSKFT